MLYFSLKFITQCRTVLVSENYNRYRLLWITVFCSSNSYVYKLKATPGSCEVVVLRLLVNGVMEWWTVDVGVIVGGCDRSSARSHRRQRNLLARQTTHDHLSVPCRPTTSPSSTEQIPATVLRHPASGRQHLHLLCYVCLL